MKHFQDLRDIGEDQPIIIKKEEITPVSLKTEVLKVLSVIVAVILLGWGISYATNNDIESANANFSVIGVVSDISDSKVSVSEARGSDDKTRDSYDLNITYLDKVETNNYEPLIISDIKVGDKIIAQGLTNGSEFFIKRIVSFTSIPSTVQEPTATSTSEEVASSTEEIPAENKPNSEEQSSGSASDGSNSEPITEPATDTSTSSSTEPSNPESATTSEESATSTTVVETVKEVVNEVVNTVTDVVEKIVDTVTGGSSEPEPAPESTPAPGSTPEPSL